MKRTISMKPSRMRKWAAVAAIPLLMAAAGQAAGQAYQTQGMFPAFPDSFSPKLIAQEDAPLAGLTPVTDEMLRAPPPSDWLLWRRTYNGWGFSPLTQINKSNVGNLRTAWTWALAPGGTETTPLVHNGVLFIQNFGDSVQALNATNGDLLWQYSRPLGKDVRAITKKGISIYGDKILLTTSDRRLIALDMKTGKPVWEQEVKGEGGYTGAPLAVNGKVIIAASNCVTSRCYITGHDIATGKELWRFNTVAGKDEPGGNSWNGLPDDERFGGSSWTSGSYDPQLNLIYWGVGQPYPWNAFARGTSPLNGQPGVTNDALYTNSTLAMDPNTGKLAWYFQHLSNDSWDYDYVFERELIDLPVNGQTRHLAITAGKMAIVEALDAKTGKFVFAHDLGLQNLVTAIDPVTGKKTIDPKQVPMPNQTISMCPHPGGARSFGATAYNPMTKVLYLPLQEHCADMTPLPRPPGEKTAPSRFTLKLRPGSDGNVGRLDALNLQTQKTVWSHRERAPQSTAALPTAGGVVFEGGFDRYFKAYDADTGRELWRTRLNDVPNSFPITYSVGGKQYVAVAVGAGSAYTRTWGNLVPDIRNAPTGGATLWVFELPGGAPSTGRSVGAAATGRAPRVAPRASAPAGRGATPTTSTTSDSALGATTANGPTTGSPK